MQTKLTLRMDSELIARAKAHARQNGKSLSEFVADYFAQFERPSVDTGLSPVVASLAGCLKGADPALLDEGAHHRYLQEKYQ